MSKFKRWINRHPDYKGMPGIIDEYSREHNLSMTSADFLRKAFLSYVKYGDETLQRDIIVKRSTISTLRSYFEGNCAKEYAENINASIDDMYNTIYAGQE